MARDPFGRKERQGLAGAVALAPGSSGLEPDSSCPAIASQHLVEMWDLSPQSEEGLGREAATP